MRKLIFSMNKRIKQFTYPDAYQTVMNELSQIEHGQMIEFCKKNKINYNVLRNFKSDTKAEYPKLVLKLLNIFFPTFTQKTEYIYIKTPLKTHSNENPRPIKSRNRPLKK